MVWQAIEWKKWYPLNHSSDGWGKEGRNWVGGRTMAREQVVNFYFYVSKIKLPLDVTKPSIIIVSCSIIKNREYIYGTLDKKKHTRSTRCFWIVLKNTRWFLWEVLAYRMSGLISSCFSGYMSMSILAFFYMTKDAITN